MSKASSSSSMRSNWMLRSSGICGAVGLVLGIVVVAEGAAQVKGHGQVVGLFVAQHVEQHRGKAKDGVGQLALGRGHVGRQGKIGAVDQRVPVDQYQFGRISHPSLQNGRMCRQCAACAHSLRHTSKAS